MASIAVNIRPSKPGLSLASTFDPKPVGPSIRANQKDRSDNNGWVRRCRPLLGTYVEIGISGLEEKALHAAIDAAFRAVENLQRRLSAHDPASEISLLNREADRHPIKVNRETFLVLRRAHQLAIASEGAF